MVLGLKGMTTFQSLRLVWSTGPSEFIPEGGRSVAFKECSHNLYPAVGYQFGFGARAARNGRRRALRHAALSGRDHHW